MRAPRSGTFRLCCRPRAAASRGASRSDRAGYLRCAVADGTAPLLGHPTAPPGAGAPGRRPLAWLARAWSRTRRQTARRGPRWPRVHPHYPRWWPGGGQDGQGGAPPVIWGPFFRPVPTLPAYSLSLHLSLVSAALWRRGASATAFFSPPSGAAAPAPARCALGSTLYGTA